MTVSDVVELSAAILRDAGFAFDRLSVVQMNRSTPRSARLALLVFVDRKPAPSAFIKVAYDPAGAKQLESEHANLSYLQRRGSSALRASVPQPLWFGERSGCTVLAESALAGMRMKNLPPDAYFASPRFADDFIQAVGWLHELQLAASPDLLPAPDGAVAAIEHYQQHFAASAGLTRLLAETAELLSSSDVRRTPWHGDFCTANILLQGNGGVSVIDWQYPLVMSWPLSDLLHFIASLWCVRYGRGSAALLSNYRRIFFEGHRHSDMMRHAVRWYAERLGIGADLMLGLSVLSWVAYANRKREELLAIGGPGTNPSAHMPLIMFDGDRCLNLEILAERRADFQLTA